MRSQEKLKRRQKKANARRKDFVRRRNINNNVPSIEIEEKIEKFAPDPKRPHVDREGRANVIHVGYKYKRVRVKNYKHKDKEDPSRPAKDVHDRNVGMIQYPLRRAFKKSKKK